jgi:hypothetical protein
MVGRIYPGPKPPPAPDAPQRLVEALLSSEMRKSPRAVSIQFSTAADSDKAWGALRGLVDGYTPPRK